MEKLDGNQNPRARERMQHPPDAPKKCLVLRAPRQPTPWETIRKNDII